MPSIGVVWEVASAWLPPGRRCAFMERASGSVVNLGPGHHPNVASVKTVTMPARRPSSTAMTAKRKSLIDYHNITPLILSSICCNRLRGACDVSLPPISTSTVKCASLGCGWSRGRGWRVGLRRLGGGEE